MSQLTPGRSVHFYSKAVADRDPARPGHGFNGQGAGPYVAIVTQAVPGSKYANLLVLPPFADPFHEGSVANRVDAGEYSPDDHVPTRYWDWPIAKAETLALKEASQTTIAEMRAARGKQLCARCGREFGTGRVCICGV